MQMEASSCPQETACLKTIASDAMTEILCIDHLFFTYHPDYYRCQDSWLLQSPHSDISKIDAMKRAAVSHSDFVATLLSNLRTNKRILFAISHCES